MPEFSDYLLPVVLGAIVIGLVVYYSMPKEESKLVKAMRMKSQRDSETLDRVRIAASNRISALEKQLAGRTGRPQRLASDSGNGNGSGGPRDIAKLRDTAGRGYLGQPGTIWESPLEKNSTSEGLARASTGTWQKGARVHTMKGGDDARLFNYTDAMDPLSAADAKVGDLFPKHDHSKAKDGNDAIAQVYSFDNFRAAHDRNTRQGFLRPQLTRSGWGRLGERSNYTGWLQTSRWLRDQLGSKENIDKFQEDLMIPVPDQYLDLSYDASYDRGIVPRDPYEGIGGVAVRELAADLEREADGAPRMSRQQRGDISKAVHQRIPLYDAAAAARVMREISKAIEVGNKGGFPQQMDPDQLRAVSNWIHSEHKDAQSAAYGLYKAANVPLPPSIQ